MPHPLSSSPTSACATVGLACSVASIGWCGVVGRSGAGKSALLSLILADNPQAYANDVALFGRRRDTGETIWEIRERIGCVSPELHLFHLPGQTALEVVSSGFHDSIGLYRGASPRQLRAATSWLRKLGILRCQERRFGELSEGEQQLVLLARALVKEPELLILDEPCQGLDAANRRRFLNLLEGVLRRSDNTLIHV
jgi:molybdate transport system ATP-binding protein